MDGRMRQEVKAMTRSEVIVRAVAKEITIHGPPCAPLIPEYKLKLTDNGYPHGHR